MKEAQALGFAEADPTADVEGHDVQTNKARKKESKIDRQIDRQKERERKRERERKIDRKRKGGGK